MAFERHVITVTTNGVGGATAYLPTSGLNLNGRVYSVTYIKTDYTNGVDFTITSETTLQDIWVEADVNASATRSPRIPTHDPTDGSALLYAAAGTAVAGHIAIGDERIKIVLAQGGDTKSGTFHVVMET